MTQIYLQLPIQIQNGNSLQKIHANYNLLRMLQRVTKFYIFNAKRYSPASLFEQRKLMYQLTSQLLRQQQFKSKQQLKFEQKDLPASVYCGYDPTADSLHLGNLVSIIMMARLQKLLGFRPIFLLGGATGLIGDPSGKKEQRDLLAQQRVKSNLQSISKEIKTVYGRIEEDLCKNRQQYGLPAVENSKQNQAIFLNNYEFYRDMNVVTFLRDIGKSFRMAPLLAKQIVSNRLQSENGLSYTQFSYSILQSYDFYVLRKNYGCLLQFGGSDQWGNITNGCDLIRRLSKGTSQGFGITMPLLLNKNGQKFGKSEGNALFLNSNKTPISKVYDYLYNTADDEVQKLMHIFTFYSPAKIQQMHAKHKLMPQQRLMQKVLAEKVTSWLGSYKNLKQELVKLNQNDLKNKNAQQVQKIYEQLDQQMKSELKYQLFKTQCKFLADLLVKLNLCRSKNEARKDIEGEGIYINNKKILKNSNEVPLTQLVDSSKLDGNFMLVRRGKKKYFMIKIKD